MTSSPELEQPPGWLRDHLKVVGHELHLEQLSSRRGVTTFTAESGSTKLLVKVAETTPDEVAADQPGVLRELAVLTSVEALQQRFSPTLLRNGDDVALVENWIDGMPAFRDVSALIASGNGAAVIELLRRTLRAVELLHSAGWSHGDLQPPHFLLADGGAVLLDYGVAQSGELPMDDYRGGMVHFNAPEVAAEIIARGSATATPTSDIFSLGAVFAFAIMGRVVGDYDKSVPWDDKLAALARGRLRTDLLRTALTKAPTLLKILLKLLDTEPLARPRDASAALQLLPATI